jgi:hypothetical protein
MIDPSSSEEEEEEEQIQQPTNQRGRDAPGPYGHLEVPSATPR